MSAKQPPAGPFAALAGLRDRLPAGDPAPAPAAPSAKAAPAAPSAKAAPAAPSAKAGPARAVVRYERKGRGGKEATLVEKLELPAGDLETWCRDLKRALGCGGAVEGDAIALAGDHRKRLPLLLEARGVRRVTVS